MEGPGVLGISGHILHQGEYERQHEKNHADPYR
jgi:hypothetical protein